MPSPFILCHHLSRLHHQTFPYFRVGPRASSPCPHPLFCVIIWVAFITKHFLILELVPVRVLHALTLYSVSASFFFFFFWTSLFRKSTQHGRRPKLKLRPDAILTNTCIQWQGGFAHNVALVSIDDYIQWQWWIYFQWWNTIETIDWRKQSSQA